MHSQLNYSTRVKRNKKKENEKQINKVTSCKQKVHQLFFKIYFKKRKLQIYIYIYIYGGFLFISEELPYLGEGQLRRRRFVRHAVPADHRRHAPRRRHERSQVIKHAP